MLLLSATSTIGHLTAQSSWSSLTTEWRICLIKWLAHSVAPFICGWNVVDIRGFVSMSHWSSHQKMDMNFVSWSKTTESGTPWSLMTSFRNSQTIPLAVTLVIVGTRWVLSWLTHFGWWSPSLSSILALTPFACIASSMFCHSHQFADAVLIGLSHQPPYQFCSPSLLPSSNIPAISKKHLQGQAIFYFTLTTSHAGSSIWDQGSVQVRTIVVFIIYFLDSFLC